MKVEFQIWLVKVTRPRRNLQLSREINLTTNNYTIKENDQWIQRHKQNALGSRERGLLLLEVNERRFKEVVCKMDRSRGSGLKVFTVRDHALFYLASPPPQNTHLLHSAGPSTSWKSGYLAEFKSKQWKRRSPKMDGHWPRHGLYSKNMDIFGKRIPET